MSNYSVVKNPVKGWDVKKDNGKRASIHVKTQKEAEKIAIIQVAEKSESKDGIIFFVILIQFHRLTIPARLKTQQINRKEII